MYTERIERMPSMFAPVHELARHIHIINTYCREAEYIQDALHLVLWEVLDDLVELHAKISPTSLFAGIICILLIKPSEVHVNAALCCLGDQTTWTISFSN